MANFGPLTAEVGSGVCGTTANFNEFRVLPSLLQRRRSTDLSQTMHGVWPSPVLVQDIYSFGGSCGAPGILPCAKFTLRPSLAFAYIDSVSARQSISGRQQSLRRRTRNGITELS